MTQNISAKSFIGGTLVSPRTRRALIFTALWIAFLYISTPLLFPHRNEDISAAYWWGGGLYAYPLVLSLFLTLDKYVLQSWQNSNRNCVSTLGFSILLMCTSYAWIWITIHFLAGLLRLLPWLSP